MTRNTNVRQITTFNKIYNEIKCETKWTNTFGQETVDHPGSLVSASIGAEQRMMRSFYIFLNVLYVCLNILATYPVSNAFILFVFIKIQVCLILLAKREALQVFLVIHALCLHNMAAGQKVHAPLPVDTPKRGTVFISEFGNQTPGT